MDPRSELLVFSKKEISIIIVLLILVALFSFTLGLRLGRSLGGPKPAEQAETAPLVPGKTEAPKPSTEEAEKIQQAEKSGLAKEQTPEEAAEAVVQKAEDRADADLAKEASKEKVGIKKPVPMALPEEKVGNLTEGARYTLQFGSYRTVAEAAEQVSALKHNQLKLSAVDVFYFETKVPGKGTWYRVGVGSFGTEGAAKRAGEKIKGETKGLPPFFVQRIAQ